MPNTSKHTSKVRGFFDNRVAGYDAFYDEPSRLGRWFNRTFRAAVYLRRDQVVELAKLHHCRTLLDVGCGSGQNSVWFARHGIERLCGVDISSEMIDQSRALADRANVADKCDFHHSDLESLDHDQRFDIVCALGVLDYIEHPGPFLARMAERANRVVYASFPGWTLVRSPLRKIRYTLRGCPTHFYRQGEIRGLFDTLAFGEAHLRPVPSGFLAWAVKQGAARHDPVAHLDPPA